MEDTMKHIRFVLFLLLVSPHRAFAASVMLPTLQKTAQGVALGDSASTLTGLNALGVNPAGLSIPHAEFLADYQSMLLDTSLTILGFAQPVASLKTTFGLSYLNMRSVNFDKRDESGQRLGSFATQDHLLSLSSARPFQMESLLANPLYLGLSIKAMQMQIDSYKTRAYALDLGGRYTLSAMPLSLGFSVLNLGNGPKFISETSPLPTSLVASAGYQISGTILVMANLNHRMSEGRNEFSIGAQYAVGDVLAIRGKSSFLQGGAASGAMGMQNLSAGLGLKLYRDTTLDYAFQAFDTQLQKAGQLGTHRVTLTFRLGNLASRNRNADLEVRRAPLPYGYPDEKLARRAPQEQPTDFRDALKDTAPKGRKLMGLEKPEIPQTENKEAVEPVTIW